MEKVGTEELDGETVTRYTVEYDIDLAVNETKYAINTVRDFWVGTTGQLVQNKQVQTYPQDLDKGIDGLIIMWVGKIGGVGEPNVITAPALEE